MKIEQDMPVNAPALMEDVRQVLNKKQKTYLGTIMPQNGHKLWEMDLATGVISEAKFEINAVDITKIKNGQAPSKKSVMTKEGCKYFSSLNKRSVIKKYMKGMVANPQVKDYIEGWLLSKNNLKK